MATPIVYVTEYSGIANLQPGGSSVAMGNLPPLTGYAILGTTGGIKTLAAIQSAGSGLVNGVYTNQPTISSNSLGVGARVAFSVVASAISGQITVVSPGYGYTSGSMISPTGSCNTGGAVLASANIATILPCGPPFNPATQLVEITADGGGTTPPLIVIDTVLSSTGYNGVLSTQQGTLTTATGLRLNANERILRGVAPSPGSNQMSVIMGTAAA